MRDEHQAALDAEAFRRTHCDNPERRGHKCMGKVTIAPGILLLDCILCGDADIPTRDAIEELDDQHERERKLSELIRNYKSGDSY